MVLLQIKAMESTGFSRGILDGALIRMFQVISCCISHISILIISVCLFTQIMEQNKMNKYLNSDLPVIPSGSLGSFREGLQSLPLKV